MISETVDATWNMARFWLHARHGVSRSGGFSDYDRRLNMSDNTETKDDPQKEDLSLEVAALKEEIVKLKETHKGELQKLTDENNALKTKLVNYLTFPPEAKKTETPEGGLSSVDAWIQGKE